MKKEYTYAATSILCWSTVATITKILLNNLNNFQVLWISSFFAMLFLFFINILKGNLKKLKNYSVKDYIITVLIGIPGTFLYYVFYYAGTDLMPASQAFIVNYLWPIMSVMFACIVLKEKMTLRKGVAIAISFLGVCIVTGGDIMQFNQNTILGAIMCALGAVSYGLFTSLNQKTHYEKEISMMINYFTTFILTSIINIISGDIFIPDFIQMLGFAWNGIFTMAIASTVWILALESGKTAKISNLAYITPFLSLVWTFLILKEKISINSLAGLVVIVFGILIQLKKKTQPDMLTKSK